MRAYHVVDYSDYIYDCECTDRLKIVNQPTNMRNTYKKTSHTWGLSCARVVARDISMNYLPTHRL